MDWLDEDAMSEDCKWVRDQIAVVKAGKSPDAKKLLSILYEETDSDTEAVIYKLVETARRKGDKSAKQFATAIQAAFEKHVATIAKKPRKWFEAPSAATSSRSSAAMSHSRSRCSPKL